jgi:hypothetical protein
MPTKVKSLLNIASFVIEQVKERVDRRAERRAERDKPVDDGLAEESQSDTADLTVDRT